MPDSVLFGRVEAEFADLDRRMIRSELVEVGDRTNVDVEPEDLSGASPYSFLRSNMNGVSTPTRIRECSSSPRRLTSPESGWRSFCSPCML
jgi:hypothetical protein